MFRGNTNNNRREVSGNIDASNNIFYNNNRSNYNNRYYNRDNNEAPPPQNIFRQGDNRRDYRSYNDNRNMFNNNRPAPVVKEPEVKPFPSMDDFPALGLSSKTKAAATAAAAVVPVPVKSFAKIAEDASTIVVPKPTIKKPANNETASSVAHKPYIPSGKRRMTLNEFMERRKDGQKIDMDDVSICSEYSNNIIDDSDDDDDEY